MMTSGQEHLGGAGILGVREVAQGLGADEAQHLPGERHAGFLGRDPDEGVCGVVLAEALGIPLTTGGAGEPPAVEHRDEVRGLAVGALGIVTVPLRRVVARFDHLANMYAVNPGLDFMRQTIPADHEPAGLKTMNRQDYLPSVLEMGDGILMRQAGEAINVQYAHGCHKLVLMI